jgi:nitric oxide reductase subunit B
MWRFWIIHLWVAGFFELFAAVLAARTFYQMGHSVRSPWCGSSIWMGSASSPAASSAPLTTGAGPDRSILSWPSLTMALAVVPPPLLTLDAWDYIGYI